MSNYKRGRSFEFRVRDIFRSFGFQEERKAASSPYDIIVMKDGNIEFLVEVKKTVQKGKDFIYLKRVDLERILKECKKLGAKGLVVYGFYRSPPYVIEAERLKHNSVIRLEPGLELKEFLKNYCIPVMSL